MTAEKLTANMTRPVNEWPVRIVGLMRCCTVTLRLSDEPVTDGHILHCLYCRDSMRLRDGAWEWHPDRTVIPTQTDRRHRDE